jgi:hypothetical protein
LVIELYSTHRAWARRPVQSGQEQATGAEMRAGPGRCRKGLRDSSWPNWKARNWISADVVRLADGVLAEHWDVLQDEATKAEARSGLPMFGTMFPE